MSLLAWAEQLPEHWTLQPLRSASSYVVSNVDKVSRDHETPVRLCNYKDVYDSEFITLARPFMQGTASEAEIIKFGVAVGDVIITKDSESWDDIGVPALVRETADDLVCGYHLALLRPFRQMLHGGFLLRCLQARPIRVQLELAARGVTRFGLPKSEIGAMKLPVPPLAQQRVIAEYLDRETARLDALVAAKERLLGLLAEKCGALIGRAVTRGLDARAPLCESRSFWLGETPAHWTQCHLKRVLVDVDYGISTTVDIEGSIAVLRMGDIRDGELDYSRVGFVEEVDEALLLQRGDLVFNRTNSLDQIGKVALFRGNAEYPVSFASYLVRFRCGPSVLPEFLNHLLNSSFARAWGRAEARPAIGQSNLNPNRFGYLPVALPPAAEQREIVQYISCAVSSSQSVRVATKKSITLLKERRAALISAAVTGHLDVRGAA